IGTSYRTRIFPNSFFIPEMFSIKTKTTTKSSTRKVPNMPVLEWEDFLANSFYTSIVLDTSNHVFSRPNITGVLYSEDSFVDLFLKVIEAINNKRLILCQPDAIQCSTDTTPLLYNLKSDTILSVVEVKPEQLMSDLINDEIELLNAYNTALIAEDDGSTVYIKHMKIIRIVRQLFGHTEDNTSFLEYMYYFEKLSTTNLVAHSSLSNTDGYDRENSRHLRFKASKFGVLHEAFIFILTLLARESFANVSNITKEKKQLAINSLLVIHARGVKHENGRRAGHGIS
ncbi:3208_t:CDS:2, partial [Funneliformis geosporum]